MTRLTLRCMIVLATISGQVAAAGGIRIVDSGQPTATIVIAEKASEQTTEAARILQKYLALMSGARLEIRSETEPVVGNRILVGPSRTAAELGIDSGGKIITYCNSGQLAAASWFVFSELLGNKNVSLYDGSMHQWAVEKRPVVKMKME